MRRGAIAAPAPGDDGFSRKREELERQLRLHPDDVAAAHYLALLQGFEGDFEGSADALEALSLRMPNDLEIRYDLAMAQMQLGNVEAACEHLRFILQLNPTHEKALQQSTYC